ncbi:AIPR family protein [Spirosoma flavus]
MNLDEFAADFLENVHISIESEEVSVEDAITADILEYIKDSGEVLEPLVCTIKARGMRINAYDYDDDNETIDLFVTVGRDDARIQKVSDKEILDSFGKAEKLFNSARNGNITDKNENNDELLPDFISIVQQTKTYVKNVRIFVLTNGICSAHMVPNDREENGIHWDYELWDIERVYQQYLIQAGKQKIEINFERDYNFRLKCLPMDDVSDKVDVYIAILPAQILADIYGQYRQGLLEKNVRTFLQFKVKVNNGIRETIRNQPDMFFAYNNGISTTAQTVDVSYEAGVTYLNRIENLQIVNGGQTTASIYYTSREKGIDLSKVFVPMKISVVKTGNSLNEIIPSISQYANSQTAIKASDFSSNSPYQVSIERWSRSEWIPELSGSKAVSKWYYERTRGQYPEERSRQVSKKDQNRFDTEYPKKHKITKTDLAKYEMCWRQRPHDAGKGGEKNYLLFLKEVDQNSEITKSDYQQLIAKAILFQEIDKLVSRKKLAGYKANVVAYTVSMLSFKTSQRLNLISIWQHQKLNEELQSFIDHLLDIVWQHVTNPPKQGMNVTEWCKRLECWSSLKAKFIDITPLNNVLKAADDHGVQEQRNEHELKIIDEASGIKGETWFYLARWAKENNELSPFDRKLAYNLGVQYRRGIRLSLKQAKNALRILKESSNRGCIINE